MWLIKYIGCLYKKKSLVAGKIAQWAEALAAQMSPLLRVLKVYFSACQSSDQQWTPALWRKAHHKLQRHVPTMHMNLWVKVCV